MTDRVNRVFRCVKRIFVGITYIAGTLVTAFLLRNYVLGDRPDIGITKMEVECDRPDGNCLVSFTAVNNGTGTGVIENVVLRVAGTRNMMVILPRPTFGNDTIDISDLYSVGQARGATINMEVKPKETEVFTILLRATPDGYSGRVWHFETLLETSDGEILLNEIVEIKMKQPLR